MAKYLMEIEVNEKKLEDIFDRIEKAKMEIYECYSELRALGVAKLTKELVCEDTHQQ